MYETSTEIKANYNDNWCDEYSFYGSIIVDPDDVNDDVIKVYEDTTQVKDTQDY